MNLWEDFVRPRSIVEALEAFATAERPLAPIAGGTDLLIELGQRRHPPVRTLVDISSIPELLALELRGEQLFVGAAVPLRRIVESSLVRQHAVALVEACALIGGPQVRNVATLGGNVAHALPAADGTIALLALDARAEVARADGTRQVPFTDLFAGPGRSSLRAGEDLLVGFYLPLVGAGGASSFKRLMRPQGVALPILNVAVWLLRRADRLVDVHIAVGPGGPTPWRADRAEHSLKNQALADDTIKAARSYLLEQAGFRSSARRAGVEYRRQTVASLFEGTLRAAWERAAA